VIRYATKTPNPENLNGVTRTTPSPAKIQTVTSYRPRNNQHKHCRNENTREANNSNNTHTDPESRQPYQQSRPTIKEQQYRTHREANRTPQQSRFNSQAHERDSTHEKTIKPRHVKSIKYLPTAPVYSIVLIILDHHEKLTDNKPTINAVREIIDNTDDVHKHMWTASREDREQTGGVIYSVKFAIVREVR
jgi:hypothetical protein